MKKIYELEDIYTLKRDKFCKDLKLLNNMENFILQLDDDIILEKLFKNLLKSLKKLGKGNVVGPLFKDLSGEPIYKITDLILNFL